MTAIAVVPLVLKNSTVTIGTDSFEQAVTSVVFDPAVNILTQATVSPVGVYSDISPAVWSVKITFLQDWATAGSLAHYLYTNQGTAVTMSFDPIAGGATVTATVLIPPGSIGGDVGVFALSTVTFGVRGAPVLGA